MPRKPDRPASPPCYLGWGTMRQCPNLCRGECGWCPERHAGPQGIAEAPKPLPPRQLPRRET